MDCSVGGCWSELGRSFRELSYGACSHFPPVHEGSNERGDTEGRGVSLSSCGDQTPLAKVLQHQGQDGNSLLSTLSQTRASKCRCGTPKQTSPVYWTTSYRRKACEWRNRFRKDVFTSVVCGFSLPYSKPDTHITQ